MSAQPQLNIAIVGAGFAGLASGALLARSGHRVTVFEKFAQAQAVGAGVLIQPSGIAAMHALGLADEVMGHGQKVDHLFGITPGKRRVIDVRYSDWQAGSHGLGLHRGVLFNALWNLARECGAEVVTGHEVQELSILQAQHDLTVIADGSRSSLRAQTGLAVRDTVYPWGAVWAVLADPERKYGSTLWQWYRSAGQMMGIMPTGRAPGSDTPVVSLFWSLRADRYAAFQRAGLDAFKRDVLALNPDCIDLLDQLHSLEQLTFARYHDVVMPQYHTDRCVVVGDAAHATSPQLGQGTNLALLDALALDGCLKAAPNLQSGLALYSRQRRQHLHFYGQASRWLTPFFQSDLRLLPWLRDLLMNASSRLPLAGALSRETLVGVRQSWLPDLPGKRGSQLDLALLAAQAQRLRS
jgi:2-polyprenyl-6-methoxyphenol hydroxylase-like FAD-dependent oxidoreductase